LLLVIRFHNGKQSEIRYLPTHDNMQQQQQPLSFIVSK